MRTKAQTEPSLKPGSLFLEKDAIFPTGRTRQALKSGARGSSKAARQRGKRPAMMLPARAGRGGACYSAPGYTKKGRGEAFSTLSLLSLHASKHIARRRRRQASEETCWHATRVGDEAKGHLAGSRPQESPEEATERPGAHGGRQAGRAAEGHPRGPAARLRAEPPRIAPARGVGGTRSPPRPSAPRSRDKGLRGCPSPPSGGPGRRGGAPRGA